MPTLQDVAKRAGVSTATVSKVLSNTPYFSEDTRERVMSAVRELGYRPNLAARALSSGRTHTLAIIFPYVYDSIFRDPLVLHILEGIEPVCSAEQYNILVSSPQLTEEGPDEQYRQLLQSGYIEGVIAIDNVSLASVAAECNYVNMPVVVLGHHEATYSVKCDEFQGGRLAFEHLFNLGHRRIGVITIELGINLAIDERMAGIRAAAVSVGLDEGAIPVAYGDFSAEGGEEATASLLTEHPELTAIICMNDRMAIGAISKLGVMNLSVPGDISVVGYDDIAVSRLISPPLTTVNQHAIRMGEISARMIFEIIQGREPKSVILQPDLIVRGSTTAPTK